MPILRFQMSNSKHHRRVVPLLVALAAQFVTRILHVFAGKRISYHFRPKDRHVKFTFLLPDNRCEAFVKYDWPELARGYVVS